MKNYSEILIVPSVQRWRRKSDGATGQTTDQRRMMSAEVTSSAIVKGDHVRPNAWSYQVRRCTSLYGTVNRTNFGNFEYYNAGVIRNDGLPQIPGLSSHLYNDLLDRLNEKVRGGIDLSIDAFQAGQTKRMFSAASQIEDLARHTRRRAKGVASAIGSLWLQYRYGWAPLLGTIHDAGEKLMNHSVKRLKFSARIGQPVPLPKARLNGAGGPAAPASGWSTYTGSQFEGYACSIRLKASNNALQSLAGWTSLNPASIAWELVPYSFVVDWFVDVGGYMRNLETGLLYRSAFDSGWITSLQAGNVQESWSFADGSGYGQGHGSHMYRRVVRQKLTTYPLPRVPSFRCDLGSGRLLNAAALLSQHLK